MRRARRVLKGDNDDDDYDVNEPEPRKQEPQSSKPQESHKRSQMEEYLENMKYEKKPNKKSDHMGGGK
jgi:hypothetical protein